MPLKTRVSFDAALERCSKVQVPNVIRWEFKLETDQVLKVSASVHNVPSGLHFFYAKIGKDGRILIPKVTLLALQGREPNLTGYLLDVTIEPASEVKP